MRYTTAGLLAWNAELDTIAVERAVHGDPPATMTRAERHEAVRRLHGYGLTARQIAARIGCTRRTVERARGALGLTNPRGAR